MFLCRYQYVSTCSRFFTLIVNTFLLRFVIALFFYFFCCCCFWLALLLLLLSLLLSKSIHTKGMVYYISPQTKVSIQLLQCIRPCVPMYVKVTYTHQLFFCISTTFVHCNKQFLFFVVFFVFSIFVPSFFGSEVNFAWLIFIRQLYILQQFIFCLIYLYIRNSPIYSKSTVTGTMMTMYDKAVLAKLHVLLFLSFFSFLLQTITNITSHRLQPFHLKGIPQLSSSINSTLEKLFFALVLKSLLLVSSTMFSLALQRKDFDDASIPFSSSRLVHRLLCCQADSFQCTYIYYSYGLL